MERRARRSDEPPAVASQSPADSFGISWTGLAGGVLGFVIMIALAISVAAGAGDASPWWAAPLAALGAIFAAAGWVSVKALASRERWLKGIVILVIVLGVIGAPQYGLELLLVLAPPISLLAQAAGLIFRGR